MTDRTPAIAGSLIVSRGVLDTLAQAGEAQAREWLDRSPEATHYAMVDDAIVHAFASLGAARSWLRTQQQPEDHMPGRHTAPHFLPPGWGTRRRNQP